MNGFPIGSGMRRLTSYSKLGTGNYLMNEVRLGEITESCTTEFTAQSYELYGLPPLGSLVKTKNGDTEIFGVVYNAATGSIEPGRKPIARGKEETAEEAIFQSNPQLLKLLRSEFAVLLVGHKHDERMYWYLPPQPDHIHGFVYQCTPQDVKEFSQSFAFFNILINAHTSIPNEELIAASLREMSLVHEDRRAFLISAGKELAALLGSQYQQLRAILGRLQI